MMNVRKVDEVLKLTPQLSQYVEDTLDVLGLKQRVYSKNSEITLESNQKSEIPFYTVERPLSEAQKDELLSSTCNLEKHRFVSGLLRDMFYTITYAKEDQLNYKLHLGPLSTDNTDIGFSVYIEKNVEGFFLVLEFSFALEKIATVEETLHD